jgi:hypothetical protein
LIHLTVESKLAITLKAALRLSTLRIQLESQIPRHLSLLARCLVAVVFFFRLVYRRKFVIRVCSAASHRLLLLLSASSGTPPGSLRIVCVGFITDCCLRGCPPLAFIAFLGSIKQDFTIELLPLAIVMFFFLDLLALFESARDYVRPTRAG